MFTVILQINFLVLGAMGQMVMSCLGHSVSDITHEQMMNNLKCTVIYIFLQIGIILIELR